MLYAKREGKFQPLEDFAAQLYFIAWFSLL